MQNRIVKVLVMLAMVFAVLNGSSQTKQKTTTKSKSTTKKTTTATAPKSAPVPVTVKLTSKCEAIVMIYSGPKSNLRDPKLRQIGGLSVNNLYLKSGDAVCIMDAKKKPISCANVTAKTTQMEINNAGTAVVVP